MMRSAPALLCAVMFVVGCSPDEPDAGAVATSTTGAPATPTSEAPTSTTVGAISCVSRLDGLTCTHARTRRGFFLSRESYKLF